MVFYIAVSAYFWKYKIKQKKKKMNKRIYLKSYKVKFISNYYCKFRDFK